MQNINYPSNYRYLMEAAGESRGPSPSQRCMCKARRLAQAQQAALAAQAAEAEKQQLLPSKVPGTSQAFLSAAGSSSTRGCTICPCNMRRAKQQQQQQQQQPQQQQQQQPQQQQLVPVQSSGQPQSCKFKCPCGRSSSNLQLAPNGAGSDEEFFSLSSASSERDENIQPHRNVGSYHSADNVKACNPRGCALSAKQSSPQESSQPANVQLQVQAHVQAQVQKQHTGTATTVDSTSVSQARNTAILQLLHEVVHLINEDGVRGPCNITPAKMRNIGNYGKEDSSADNGPFSSSLKVAYTPSRKDSSPSERSEGVCPCQARRALASQQALVSSQALAKQQALASQQALSQMQSITQPMTIPLQFPCNLIITPIQFSPQDAQSSPVGSQFPPVGSQLAPIGPQSPHTSQKSLRASSQLQSSGVGISHPDADLPPTGVEISQLDNALPPVDDENPAAGVQFQPNYLNPPEENFDGANRQDEVVKDLELMEGIAALAMQPPSGDVNLPEDSGNCCDEGCSDPNSGHGHTKRCTLDGCICPVHGVFIPSGGREEDSSVGHAGEDYEDEDGEKTELTDGAERSTSRSRGESSRKPGQSGGAECGVTDAEECNCCHCRAMRQQEKNSCMTIATPQQAMGSSNGSCSELKFFIDSIIMDLDAMDHARRKKQIDQDICRPKAKICPRKSYPVTITDVTDLGTSSLYVKWCIHDCFGIGGYEIYVDGYLTNRYFHCNHEAAVVCDVDVGQPHKIVLLAQPKLDERFDEICCCSGPGDKGKQLLRKSDAEKMKKPECAQPALWTPSIYLYDPTNRDDVPPIRRGTM